MQTIPFEKGDEQHQVAAKAVPSKFDRDTTELGDLVLRWIDHASLLARYGAASCAETLRRCSGDLSEAIASNQDIAVSLTTASKLSAYSADHLGRLVREGKLKNYGEKNRPRVRVAELPRKPIRVAAANSNPYDAITDARNLRSRGRRVA